MEIKSSPPAEVLPSVPDNPNSVLMDFRPDVKIESAPLSETDAIKKHIVDYYIAIGNHYGAYHNQKEVAAWSGVAAYVLFCTAFARIDLAPLALSAEIRAIIIILLITFLWNIHKAAWAFIDQQLKNKDLGNNYFCAARHLTPFIIATPSDSMQLRKFLEFDKSAGDPGAKATYILPKMILAEALRIADKGNSAIAKVTQSIRIVVHASGVFVLAVLVLQLALTLIGIWANFSKLSP